MMFTFAGVYFSRKKNSISLFVWGSCGKCFKSRLLNRRQHCIGGMFKTVVSRFYWKLTQHLFVCSGVIGWSQVIHAQDWMNCVIEMLCTSA